MSRNQIAQRLHTALPHLSTRAQTIVDALLLSGGDLGTAKQLAFHIGESNRFGLARLLRREGLPPLHSLAAWTRVLIWVDTAERSGCSLCQLAFRYKKDPAVCYRTVKRVTGLKWGDLRRRGSLRVIADFIAICGAHDGPRWSQSEHLAASAHRAGGDRLHLSDRPAELRG